MKTFLCYLGLLAIGLVVLSFPPLLLLIMLLHEGPMPWNREKESGISGDL